jgi:hypothetical protein
LSAGDALWLSLSSRYALRNAGPAPVVVLTLALLPWSAGAPGGQFLWPEATLPDVTAHLLAEGVAEDLPEGPATVALGRVTLAAGIELSARGTIVPRLAVVEAGSVLLTAVAGPSLTLGAGQTTPIQPASAPTFRAAGESAFVLLLVAITPAAPT